MDKRINIVEKRVLRGFILQICSKAGAGGASLQVLAGALRLEGFQINEAELFRACTYLSGKGLVIVECIENRALSISRQVIKITPCGTDVLEGARQVDGVEIT